jgi:putative ABC transport system ATP-binding protein
MSEPIVRLSRVTKRYGHGERATLALDELSVDIARGQFVSLVGPSGSGKTTVLNLIAGLDAPDAGAIVVDGHDLSRLPDHQLADLRLRQIGFVFQAFNLIPSLTAVQNVSWPLRYLGYSRADARSRAADALARVGITGRDARHPGELSGGEQQRVAIARAIATGPSLVLADEPTGNLDSRTGQSVLDLLRVLNQTAGVTVVMVTHNAQAATYGHRTLELQDGRLAQDLNVLAHPRVDTGST